jgi:hypothetical protein
MFNENEMDIIKFALTRLKRQFSDLVNASDLNGLDLLHMQEMRYLLDNLIAKIDDQPVEGDYPPEPEYPQ